MPERNKSKQEIGKDKIVDLDNFVVEIKEESDRASVILGTAKIDYMLLQILVKYLVPNVSKNDELLESDSPLSSFSSRINVCYRLGILDATFTRALHLIRRIRNSFAHEVNSTKLNAAPHRDRIKELTSPFKDKDLFRDIKKMFFEDRSELVSEYLTCITLMVIRLDAIYLKLNVVDSSQAYKVIPSNYKSKKKIKSKKNET